MSGDATVATQTSLNATAGSRDASVEKQCGSGCSKVVLVGKAAVESRRKAKMMILALIDAE
jgi:hypothetical protein